MNLSSIKTDRATQTWLALMVFTLLSFAFGDGLGPAKAATIAAFVIAYVKVNLIAYSFMELEHAPKALRVGFLGFTVFTGTALTVIYLVA